MPQDDPAATVGFARNPKPASDREVVGAICAGDEGAWAQLVHNHSAAMLRLARMYVSSRPVAEEVVQETWLAVLTGIERFEGRSSLKTWLFRILTNQAQTRAVKEGRSVPFSALTAEDLGAAEPSVEPDSFRTAGERWADHWRSSPGRWTDLPEARLLARETVEFVERTAASLPAAQQAVLTLRDILGWDADEVCEVLAITAANPRERADARSSGRSSCSRTRRARAGETLASSTSRTSAYRNRKPWPSTRRIRRSHRRSSSSTSSLSSKRRRPANAAGSKGGSSTDAARRRR